MPRSEEKLLVDVFGIRDEKVDENDSPLTGEKRLSHKTLHYKENILSKHTLLRKFTRLSITHSQSIIVCGGKTRRPVNFLTRHEGKWNFDNSRESKATNRRLRTAINISSACKMCTSVVTEKYNVIFLSCEGIGRRGPGRWNNTR